MYINKKVITASEPLVFEILKITKNKILPKIICTNFKTKTFLQGF